MKQHKTTYCKKDFPAAALIVARSEKLVDLEVYNRKD